MNWRHLRFQCTLRGLQLSLSLCSSPLSRKRRLFLMEMLSSMTTTTLDGITIIFLLNKKKQSWNFPADANLHKHCISLSALFCVYFGALQHGTVHVHVHRTNETKRTCAVYWWLIIWVKVITLCSHFLFCFSLLLAAERERCAVLDVCKTLSRNKLKLPNYSRNAAAVVVKCTCAAFSVRVETLTDTPSSIST